MTTGTEGPDTLSNDPNTPFETVDALGGNDVINIIVPFDDGFNPTPPTVDVDGGEGFDTLNAEANLIFGQGLDRFRLHNQTDERGIIGFENVEVLNLTGAFAGSTALTFGASQNNLTLTASGTHALVSTGAGNDQVVMTGSQVGANIDLGSGDDVANLGNVQPSGPGSVFTILGGEGTDDLTGSIGNDVLDGGAGSDIMRGGAGNDIFYVDSHGDGVSDSSGDDEIRTDLTNYNMGSSAANVERLTSLGSVDQSLLGNTLNNIIKAGGGNDYVAGMAGNDQLFGEAGNDELWGAAGLDILTGGLGDDIYHVDDLDSLVEVDGQGFDRVYVSAATGVYALAAGVSIEELAPLSAASTTRFDLTGNEFSQTVRGADGHDSLRGMGGNDVLTGYLGNDLLDGGDGADHMTGGLGNDSYHVDAGDTIVELAGEGFDYAYARTNFTLAAGVHIDLLGTIDWRSTEPLALTGNEINNSVVGNSGANSLRGGGGDDSLRGLDGNDLLDGGNGRDLMIGGLGDDIYYVDSAFDQVEENAGEGFDAVYVSSDFLLRPGQHVEVLATADYRLTIPLALTGNEFNNAVTGNNGNNRLGGGGGDDSLRGLDGHDILDGGAGADLMIGGVGNDIYHVDSGDIVSEAIGEGVDSVYARTSYRLTAGAEVEVLATEDYRLTSSIDLTGNELNNSVTGNNGANTLLGGAGDDSLRGLDGNDVLDGGAGRDYLIGGAGADTFRFTSTAHSPAGSADQIADFASGSDRVDLSAIDANAGTAGDDAFAFIGAGAFSGQAGQLRVEGGSGVWFVQGDVNGDKVADFEIIVLGSAPVMTDFNF